MEALPRHPDADAILARLRKEEISRLYHFTSVNNLPSICKAGSLYSKALLSLHGILDSVDCGGDNRSLWLDRKK